MTEVFTYYNQAIVQAFVDQMTAAQRKELASLPVGISYKSMLHYRELVELAATFVDGVNVVDAGILVADGCILLNSEDENEN